MRQVNRLWFKYDRLSTKPTRSRKWRNSRINLSFDHVWMMWILEYQPLCKKIKRKFAAYHLNGYLHLINLYLLNSQDLFACLMKNQQDQVTKDNLDICSLAFMLRWFLCGYDFISAEGSEVFYRWFRQNISSFIS